MLTPIDMKEWEKTCREKTGLGFETFKTVTHCDAETLDALLEAASGSIKGTMYFDWLMEYLSLAQSGKNADVKTVVDDIDALIEMLGITPEAFERYCGKTTEDVKAAFPTLGSMLRRLIRAAHRARTAAFPHFKPQRLAWQPP